MVQYPVADCNKIFARIRDILGDGKAELAKRTDLPGSVDYLGLHSMISNIAGNQISNHEIATLARAYQVCSGKRDGEMKKEGEG